MARMMTNTPKMCDLVQFAFSAATHPLSELGIECYLTICKHQYELARSAQLIHVAADSFPGLYLPNEMKVELSFESMKQELDTLVHCMYHSPPSHMT